MTRARTRILIFIDFWKACGLQKFCFEIWVGFLVC